MQGEVILFVFLGVFTCSLSCPSGGGGGGKDNFRNITNVTKTKSARHKHKQRGPPPPFGGFPPPAGMPLPGGDRKSREEAYAYYKNTTGAAQQKHKHEAEYQDDPNWPPDWKGLGSGTDGQDPPPWAYAPKNPSGIPSYCFQAPLKGQCAESLTRWGYNPYKNTCDSYTYTGCQGSQNNFEDQEKCEKACIAHDHTFEQACDPDSHIYVDDIIAS